MRNHYALKSRTYAYNFTFFSVGMSSILPSCLSIFKTLAKKFWQGIDVKFRYYMGDVSTTPLKLEEKTAC